ncbi:MULTISPECIES: DMT family transporter [unclassified Bacillus cereus group]|uniref:DMT family transporter n=1 Tax=unclassified Bacillus cereus group TaxID=2750818 RepID=UPI001F5A952F|nr:MULTISPECIES: DMT family transporter [unclassified Bacillus cereus group]
MSIFKFTMLILLTTFLMGSSFAVGKIGLSYSSPLLLAALRFTLAGFIMAVIIIVLKRPHPTSKGHWIKMIIIGAFQTTGVMGCIFLSLRTISASESSILTFSNPLFVVIFSTIFLQVSYKISQWVGVLLGLIGVSITMGAQIEFTSGIFFGISSAIFWAIATLLVKKWGGFFDTWILSAYQMFFGGLLLLLASFFLEKPFFILNVNALLILLWLSIMSSIVQFVSWYYLLQKGDPGKISAFLFLAPFFGVLSGWLLLRERLYPSIVIGSLFIIISIYLVNRNFQQKNTLVKKTL